MLLCCVLHVSALWQVLLDAPSAALGVVWRGMTSVEVAVQYNRPVLATMLREEVGGACTQPGAQGACSDTVWQHCCTGSEGVGCATGLISVCVLA